MSAMSLVPRREAVRSHVLTDVQEHRLPTLETRQIGVLGTSPGHGGPVGVGGAVPPEKALREAYYANVYFYACVRAIAVDLAARPFRVGADPANPADFNPTHPLAVRLSPPPGGPNPTTSARRLWAWTAAQRLVLGASAWEVDSQLQFWPLPGTKFKPVPSATPAEVNRYGWFKGFEIGQAGRKRELRPDQVFYSWQPAQDDWTRAESALEAARLDVQVAVMQDVYDNAFLRNDARPATLVVHQSFASNDDEVKFRRQFLNRHQGPGNAGRVAFATATPEQGGAAPKDSVFVQALGLTQRDAMFVERYEAKIRSICIAMGVPLSRLGDASKRTFSNADRETLNYWLDTVQPVGFDLADDVNMRLMPLFDGSGNVGWFDWSGVPDLEPPRRFAVGEVLSMHQSQVITQEEARTELGFDPDTGPGEGEPAPPPAPAPVEAAAPGVTVDQVAALLDDALAPVHAALRSPTPAPAPTPAADVIAEEARLAYERRTSVWNRVDRTVRAIERRWEVKVQRLFDRQEAAALARLEGKRGRQMIRDGEPDPGNVFDEAFWQGETADMAEDLYRDVVGASLTAFDVQFGVAFDIDAEWAQDYIMERSNYLAGQLTDTTYEGIRLALAEGAENGESIPKLADRIRHLFHQTYASRAETVARTEVISAYNGSTWLSANNSPDDVIGGLQWIATRDDRTRKTHAAMDGMIIRRGEAFYLDGATMMYPGDPETATRYDSSGNLPEPGSFIVNCRCTVAPVLTSEMPERERSADERRLTRVAAERLCIDLASGALTLSDALTRVLA